MLTAYTRINSYIQIFTENKYAHYIFSAHESVVDTFIGVAWVKNLRGPNSGVARIFVRGT